MCQADHAATPSQGVKGSPLPQQIKNGLPSLAPGPRLPRPSTGVQEEDRDSGLPHHPVSTNGINKELLTRICPISLQPRQASPEFLV